MGSTKLSEEGTFPAGVLRLDDPASVDTQLVGSKAAALSVAKTAGLSVLDGFTLSTRAAALFHAGGAPPDLVADLRSAWGQLSYGGRRPLVVRSSSPNEDTAASSMAGQFTSVLDVRTWGDVLDAVDQVVASAQGGPMAVLVQPFVRPAWGGVLFGADPVTGRRDRLVVAAVPGGPDRLVSGTVTGGQFSLSPHGRLVESTGAVPPELLARRMRLHLVRLARSAAALFGAPQDIEWAVADDGGLVLLQSRPITTIAEEVEADGPVLGPGPLAETFPAALAPLEEDLWLPPLRDGLREALGLLGAGSRRLRDSPVVVSIAGRPAVDLDLLGLSPVRRSRFAWLDPRPPARRLVAAWRVGRLRSALPGLADDLLDQVDADLAAVPPLDSLSPLELLGLLPRAQRFLLSLHGYEVLAGQLLAPGDAGTTAASRALTVLVEARIARPDASDAALLADHPVLLSLSAPSIGPAAPLPPVAADRPLPPVRGSAPDNQREALRLRARWVQELTARAALQLGRVLVRRGVLRDAASIRHLRLADLPNALVGGSIETGPAAKRPVEDTPLPRAFRRAGDVIVPVAAAHDGAGGRGAGGGRGMGRVHSGTGPPPDGAVLVVSTLDPNLAAHLPGLSGLVAETGSVLSHLAILAREYGVPTVVDLPDAMTRFPAGSWILVDGATGEVSVAPSDESAAA